VFEFPKQNIQLFLSNTHLFHHSLNFFRIYSAKHFNQLARKFSKPKQKQ